MSGIASGVIIYGNCSLFFSFTDMEIPDIGNSMVSKVSTATLLLIRKQLLKQGQQMQALWNVKNKEMLEDYIGIVFMTFPECALRSPM